MFDKFLDIIGNIAVSTAYMGANTMSTFFAYEPEMPECLLEDDNYVSEE